MVPPGSVELDEENAQNLAAVKASLASPAWREIARDGGITVCNREVPPSEYDARALGGICDPARAAKFAAVRASGVLAASPAAVLALFLSNEAREKAPGRAPVPAQDPELPTEMLRPCPLTPPLSCSHSDVPACDGVQR